MQRRLIASLILLPARSSASARRPTSRAGTARIRRRKTGTLRRSRCRTICRRIAGYGLRAITDCRLRDWFEDHFGFRSTLVRWYGESRYFWLGVSPSAAVIAGRDGWLFYGDDGGIEDYANETPLSAPRARRLARNARPDRDWLRAREHRVTSSPSRRTSTSSIRRNSPRRSTGSARLRGRIRSNRSWRRHAVPVVDLRPALRRRKGDGARLLSRPTRTGTIAARSSRTSRSSTPCGGRRRRSRRRGREPISSRPSA